jgi:C-terminal processing protease CtpA/Prc
MRAIFLLLIAAAHLLSAQNSNERLSETIKLWNLVKYIHPRVTSPELDWDKALVEAIPKVLSATNDDQFAAALTKMLDVLHDPMTRIRRRSDAQSEQIRQVLTVMQRQDGVAVVRLEPGTQAEEAAARNGLMNKLSGLHAVVFDLRGSRRAPYILPRSLPGPRTDAGPSLAVRRYNGYPAENLSSQYHAYWELQDGPRLAPASEEMRSVFLVNSKTVLPMIALAMQSSGWGAIVSEDEIDDSQMELGWAQPLLGSLRAVVRIGEIIYPDQSLGLHVNVVLNQTGAEALNAALEIAKKGRWPAPQGHSKVGLPSAEYREKTYAGPSYPNAGLRILATARIWGVFHYFHPYRVLYDENWTDILTRFLPLVQRAETARAYHIAVAEMTTLTRDTHTTVNSPEVFSVYGSASPPVEVRWIENQPVVTRIFDRQTTATLAPGDVVSKIDGQPVQKRIDELRRIVAASTEQAAMNKITRYLLSGPDGSTVKVTLGKSGSAEREVEVKRAISYNPRFNVHRDGPVFRLITPKLGYADLERLSNLQVDAMFDALWETSAIILDMRGYPLDPAGTAWSIASRLAKSPAPIVAQIRRNIVGAGAGESAIGTAYSEQQIPATSKLVYTGKTVMLIDERAASMAEHTGLFFRAANGTAFIGTATNGTDGVTSYFDVPGGLRIRFGAMDVRWPDGRQLQRIGLAPDIEVRPTIQGVRAGRDEVLERAISHLQQ